MIQYIYGLPVYISSFETPQRVIDEVEYYRNNVKPKRKSQIIDELGGQIVIFPSCFSHFVERHTVDNQRMTLYTKSIYSKKNVNRYLTPLLIGKIPCICSPPLYSIKSPCSKLCIMGRFL